MECKEGIYSEGVLDYIISPVSGAAQIEEEYAPLCYEFVDSNQAIIYKEVDRISSRRIQEYGYFAVPKCYGLMDESALDATGVLRVRRQPYLDLFGTGILLGFVDTGIDYTNEIFINGDGTSRIAAIWDQEDDTGVPPAEFSYGREYDNVIINQALAAENPRTIVPQVDEDGHGTFLASVAAGNEVREQSFSGVAPLSQILMVKCKQAKKIYREYYRIPDSAPCYQENDIMLGISYLIRKAATLGKPIVICLGMGTNMGNHSGNSQLDVLMTRYMAVPGVCFVTGAGNESNKRHHYYGTLSPRSQTYDEIDIDLENNYYGFCSEIWWRSPGKYSIAVVSPSGDVMERINVQAGYTQVKSFVIEGTRLEIYFGTILEQNRDQVIFLRFENTKPGIWKIRLYRENDITTSYHVWLPIESFLSGETFFIRPDPDVTICDPGNTKAVFTATAYDAGKDSIYLEAGRGYNAINEVKPDAAAPGVSVFGVYPGNRYGTKTGTSVAAAVTCGLAALLFEEFSSYKINGIAVAELLIQGARKRDMEYPNPVWGYGEVDVYSSIISVSNIE